MNKKAVFIYGYARGAKLKYTMKAVNLAHKLHKGQERDDGTNYVEHLVGTAHLLIAHGVEDDEVLAASILHDTIEDTSYSYDDIVRDFNKRIAKMVNRVSKKKVQSLGEYLKEIEESIGALLIKAADRTHNVSDMVRAFSVERMEKYIKETEEYILPAMKRARKLNLEYGNAFVALSEHIKAVLLLAKEVIKLNKELSNKTI